MEMWNKRVDDAVFGSLDELYASVHAREKSSAERVINPAALRVAAQDGELRVFSVDKQREYQGKMGAGMTDWSFRQLCSIARLDGKAANASYLQTLPAELVVDPLNYGLEHTSAPTTKLLFAKNGDLTLRAATTKGYGRVFDAEVVDAVRSELDPDVWTVPENQPKRSPTKLFSSDRSLYIFLVDFNHPIEAPRPDGSMEVFFRGVVIGNSEVGSKTLFVQDFLFWFTCANREIWQTQGLNRIAIRHTKGAPRRFVQEVRPLLASYSTASPAPILEAIERAGNVEVADEHDKLVSWLRTKGFTRGTAQAVTMLAEQNADRANPRSVLGLVRAATEYAQTIATQDERLALEETAGKLMRLSA